jgi:hypothetical protein
VLILPSSAAFEGVTQGACPPPSVDQRGVTRPVNVRCDIGAVELQVTLTPTPTRTPTPTLTPTPTATPTCILADINCDGIVEIRDYGIWRQNFGQTNCGNPADLDGNCLVDIRDYGIWRQNFGHTAGAARASGALLAGIAPAPQGTPGPALPTGDQPVERAWPLLGAEGPSPAVPVLPVVGGLLGLGGLAEWRRRRPSGRE